jgi:hypothetical protein
LTIWQHNNVISTTKSLEFTHSFTGGLAIAGSPLVDRKGTTIMGYTTQLEGQFNLDKPLTVAHMAYLKKFAETRRMRRQADTYYLEDMADLTREAVGLPLGDEGGYFVGETGMMGQTHDASIIDYNSPPKGQPGLWCQWEPNAQGTAIVWDGSEKFYEYVKWIKYLIEHFLQPWGYIANGEVKWQGENDADTGTIIIKDNAVTTH